MRHEIHVLPLSARSALTILSMLHSKEFHEALRRAGVPIPTETTKDEVAQAQTEGANGKAEDPAERAHKLAAENEKLRRALQATQTSLEKAVQHADYVEKRLHTAMRERNQMAHRLAHIEQAVIGSRPKTATDQATPCATC